MMIENRRGPVTNGLQAGNKRAAVAILESKPPIQTPPQVAQYLGKILGRLGLDQSPGKAGIKMHVRVNESRHHYLAMSINDLSLDIPDGSLRENRLDKAILDHEGVAGKYTIRIFKSNDDAISNQYSLH